MNDKYFGSHELHARENVVKTSSDRSFGVVCAVFFALISGLNLYKGGKIWPVWFALAALLAILALVLPRILAPLNRLWTKFGLMLHVISSPIILGLIFYGCIVPAGFLMRLYGKDPLRLRFEADAESYWIRREPPGPSPESFKNQF
jgi:hypothetical protein